MEVSGQLRSAVPTEQKAGRDPQLVCTILREQKF